MMQQMMIAQGKQDPTAVYVDGATGVNSATLPAHAIGDLIVAFAFRSTSAVVPSLGAGFTSLEDDTPALGTGSRLAYRIATVTDTASGTWTNATAVAFAIYRNAAVGSTGSAAPATTSTVQYPAFAPSVPTGSSLIAAFAAINQGNTSLQTPPTGMVNRQTRANAGDEVAIHESSEGRYIWPLTTVAVGGTAGDPIVYMLEIKSV